ncbi:hypothetical protein BaRGS_00028995 [Batillaria attramentaria]|uniref:Uncharacterized protein n=1 Tax=Batillaria attramentaria TaxID=370345 RepID=A0ABD0JZ07_9CAEN
MVVNDCHSIIRKRLEKESLGRASNKGTTKKKSLEEKRDIILTWLSKHAEESLIICKAAGQVIQCPKIPAQQTMGVRVSPFQLRLRVSVAVTAEAI